MGRSGATGSPITPPAPDTTRRIPASDAELVEIPAEPVRSLPTPGADRPNPASPDRPPHRGPPPRQGGRCEASRPRASLEDVSPVTVLLAVGDPLQQAVLLRALRRADALDIVGSEHDGARALGEILRLAPDVAVIDTGLPSVGGIELCERLAGARPEVGTRVLLLEGDPPVTRAGAVASGAAGCLPATSTAAQLTDAVTSIANGGTIFHI